MFKSGREKAKMTQEMACRRIPCGLKSLQRYENGESIPPPDVALGMATTYNRPDMTLRYCSEYCAIGKAYSYDVLDNVDDTLPGTVLKLLEELSEVQDSLKSLIVLSINKQCANDFQPAECDLFRAHLHRLLDLEHTVEVIKLRAGKMGFDMIGFIAEHNQKCRDRAYTDKKKTA